MLLCVVLDCTGMRLGVLLRLKLSSLSDVSLLLSVEFDGKKEEDLFGRLFTTKKSTSKIKSKRLSYSQEFLYFQHSKSLTEQYSPVVLFIMLCKEVLSFECAD